MKRYATKLLSWIFVLACCTPAFGAASPLSSWSLPLGGAQEDVANSVQQTTDGGYIVAGYTKSFGAGNSDAWVVKLDSYGAIAWQKTYGGSGVDIASSIQQTDDGGYIVAGYTNSSGAGDYDAWVIKLDPGGSVVWQKTYGGVGNDRAMSVQQTTDGGFIVAGYTYIPASGNTNAWLLRLNYDGSIAWQKTYNGSGNDNRAYSVRQTADGGLIVSGYTNSPGAGGTDAWLLKLDANGNVGVSYPGTWQKTYGGTGNDIANSIQQTADGGYIVAGSTPGAAGGYDAWVLKLKADGSVSWQKTYGGTGTDAANSIQPTADGGYIVAGYSNSSSDNGYEAWLLKLNADGGLAWQKTYGGLLDERANSVWQTANGGYLVAGTTQSFGTAGSIDAWVMKLDLKGGMNGSGCAAVTISASTAIASDASTVSAPSTASVGTGTFTSSQTSVTPTVSNAATTLNCSFTPSPSKWQNTYGGSNVDQAKSVQQTADGGYIVAGSTLSFGAGNNDIWVLKLTEDGNIAWQKTYGDIGDDYANAIRQTAEGGYIVAGTTHSQIGGCDSNCSYAALILKLTASGLVTWQKTYGHDGDEAYDIQQTSDGGYVVAGSTYTSGAGTSDAWVLKLDVSGNVVWQTTYGGTQHDYAYAIQQTADGGYIVAGATESFGTAGSIDAWVLKLSATGSVIWQKTYGGSDLDETNSVAQTSDGGYIVSGYTASLGDGKNAWVIKLNADGTTAWQKTYGGSGYDYAYSIKQTTDGGYIVGGSTGLDAWVFKLKADGSISWQKSYSVLINDVIFSVQQTLDGGYIVAGVTNSGSGLDDILIMKLDQKGDLYGCTIANDSTALEQDVTGTINSPSVSTDSQAISGVDANVTLHTTTISPNTGCGTSYTLYLLELYFGGSGTGRVTSTPSGIDCADDCSSFFPAATPVTLHAQDPTNFIGWWGDCNLSGLVTMNADKTCYAAFSKFVNFNFTVNPASGYHPLMVGFADQSTNTPWSWWWDFGDSNTSAIKNPSHLYRRPGNYTVSLSTNGTGGADIARRINYVTVLPCPNKAVRITGPADYDSMSTAYQGLGSTGTMNILAVEFNENVDMSLPKTVTLNGGYLCDHVSPIADSIITGQFTIGGSSGSVTVNNITIR